MICDFLLTYTFGLNDPAMMSFPSWIMTSSKLIAGMGSEDYYGRNKLSKSRIYYELKLSYFLNAWFYEA